jgi:4-hydroxybenzoate polyprenyltransferase
VFQFLLAMRPHQWPKNLFVLGALVFSRHLFDPAYVLRSIAAFALFCLLSGIVYVFNDIQDRESDRQHPEKRNRPIPSKRLSVPWAGASAAVIGVLALWVSFRLGFHFGWIAVVYLGLNVAYSVRLKHVVILDVMIVASGFLLRAIGGGVVIGVEISSWFVLCTMLLALFLGFVKRRQEIVLLEGNAASARRILDEYSPQFLDQMIAVVTAGTLVSYALYTMSAEVMEKLGTQYLNLTVPFVIYGLLRYLYLVYQKGQGGNPSSTILRDPSLIINAGLWLLTLVGVLYF